MTDYLLGNPPPTPNYSQRNEKGQRDKSVSVLSDSLHLRLHRMNKLHPQPVDRT